MTLPTDRVITDQSKFGTGVSGSLLPAVAVILVSGLAVQLIARRARVPSVAFGPVGIGLLTPGTSGGDLETTAGRLHPPD